MNCSSNNTLEPNRSLSFNLLQIYIEIKFIRIQFAGSFVWAEVDGLTLGNYFGQSVKSNCVRIEKSSHVYFNDNKHLFSTFLLGLSRKNYFIQFVIIGSRCKSLKGNYVNFDGQVILMWYTNTSVFCIFSRRFMK